MTSVKEIVLDAMRSLPDDCTWEDFTYQLYVRRKVESGLAAIDRGDVYTTDEVRQKIQQWRESSGRAQP